MQSFIAYLLLLAALAYLGFRFFWPKAKKLRDPLNGDSGGKTKDCRSDCSCH